MLTNDKSARTRMNTESYINHPTFGMLFRICELENKEELFTTLYAQRLFFIVQQTKGGVNCDPVSRMDARLKVESRMRQVRRTRSAAEFQSLQSMFRRTFQ